jgi:hypothetical protein
VIELLLKLIERLIDLGKRREEQDNAFYANFIAPAFADFEALHRQYLESFRRYRERLQRPGLNLLVQDPLFNELESDVLFARDANSKVTLLLQEERASKQSEFIKAIAHYMNSAVDWSQESNAVPPVFQDYVDDRERYRISVLDRLGDYESPDDRQRWAISALDDLVGEMQRRYSAVAARHQELKYELLNPEHRQFRDKRGAGA